MIPADPRTEYQLRLDNHQQRALQLKRLSVRLSIARMVVALVAISGAVILASQTTVSQSWLVFPVLLFMFLIVVHNRVASEEQQRTRQIAFYQTGLRRLDGCWTGQGTSGEVYLEPDHPNALDLDLLGAGSLFELLCTARTSHGEQTLAEWLQHPAQVSEIKCRHEAVDELRNRLEFRERLYLQGEDVVCSLHPESLKAWGEQPARQIKPGYRFAAWVLPLLTITSYTGWMFADWTVGGFVLCGTAHFIFGRCLLGWTNSINRTMRRPVRELRLYASLLESIEEEAFVSPALCRLKENLKTDNVKPSRHIDRLCKLTVLLDSASNMVFAPFAMLLLWNLHIAILIEDWRIRCGSQLGAWFDAIGRFEALNALAGYSFEHPDDPLPEILETDSPMLSATDVAHPLLPPNQAVANDLELGTAGQVLVVSGSNMSGKSTLLRSIGINTVLAQAGAPVRASRFRMSPLAVGASIRTVDSLLDGKSRFYAEITRLKQISDSCSANAPVLFLLDEIMHGTNSHDRRIGAEALVRHLVAQGAIGLVTTHDLALAELAETLAPMVTNVHFEDTVIEGEMVFDYLLRQGTVTKSNALQLMQSVGLPVG